MVKGKNRWYAQLILEGTPLQKAHHRLGHGNITGIDIGPSTIAAVSKNEAWLKGFCSELALKSDEIKAIQRKMDSSLREMNPSNYRANGTIRPGVKTWHKIGFCRISSVIIDKNVAFNYYIKAVVIWVVTRNDEFKRSI